MTPEFWIVVAVAIGVAICYQLAPVSECPECPHCRAERTRKAEEQRRLRHEADHRFGVACNDPDCHLNK